MKTSIAKPDRGIKLKAIKVFHPAFDSLIRLIAKGFMTRKAIRRLYERSNTLQRNVYTNQRNGNTDAVLFVRNSIGVIVVSCLKYLLK